MIELKEINFAVSNACNADCIFCPRSFVDVPKEERFMTVALVDKVLREATSDEFKKEHNVVHCVMSENGEPFLNPWILDLLRTARTYNMGITLFSNFSLINEKKALAVCTEGLVDAIHFNVDGFTPESYRAAKGLDLVLVEKNIRKFIEIRNETKANIRLFGHIISQNTYISGVLKLYRSYPVKYRGVTFEEDRNETLEMWQGILKPPIDNIGIDGLMFWAERYGSVTRPGFFECPNLDRLRHCAYINPKGDWYGCCFDVGNELVIGNVNETTLMELAQSYKRKRLIQLLEEGKFFTIGFPCSCVDTCNGMTVA